MPTDRKFILLAIQCYCASLLFFFVVICKMTPMQYSEWTIQTRNKFYESLCVKESERESTVDALIKIRRLQKDRKKHNCIKWKWIAEAIGECIIWSAKNKESFHNPRNGIKINKLSINLFHIETLYASTRTQMRKNCKLQCSDCPAVQ